MNLFIFYKVKIKLKYNRPIENMQYMFVEKEMNASMNNLWHCNGMVETNSCLTNSHFSFLPHYWGQGSALFKHCICQYFLKLEVTI